MEKKTENFNYNNIEHRKMGGGAKVVREVSIENGKGYKKVTHYENDKKTFGTRRRLKEQEINSIQNGIFIKGLFKDCKKKNKTMKKKQ